MSTLAHFDDLQRRLEARAAVLRGQLATASGAPADAAGREVTDRKDDAQRELQSIVASAECSRDRDERSDRERLTHRGLAAALRRIAAGRDGRCTDCDTPIAVDRLRAQPEAGRCIDCQRSAEAQGTATRRA